MSEWMLDHHRCCDDIHNASALSAMNESTMAGVRGIQQALQHTMAFITGMVVGGGIPFLDAD